MRRSLPTSTILTLCALASLLVAGCNSKSAPSSIVAPAANTLRVTYDGNTNTGGTPPLDSSGPYAAGSSVTVLSPGDLNKNGLAFAGWNTAADGSGTNYLQAARFPIDADTWLYAQWSAPAAHVVFLRWRYLPATTRGQWQGTVMNRGTAVATNIQVSVLFTCPFGGTAHGGAAVNDLLPGHTGYFDVQGGVCGGLAANPQVLSLTWR